MCPDPPTYDNAPCLLKERLEEQMDGSAPSRSHREGEAKRTYLEGSHSDIMISQVVRFLIICAKSEARSMGVALLF